MKTGDVATVTRKRKHSTAAADKINKKVNVKNNTIKHEAFKFINIQISIIRARASLLHARGRKTSLSCLYLANSLVDT